MRNKKDHKRHNGGFSLIELIIVMGILAILSSLLYIGPGVFRRRKIDEYTRTLCNQIRYMQTVSMTRSGDWRLALYIGENDIFCVQERRGETSDGGYVWSEMSGRTELGRSETVSYQRVAGEAGSLYGEQNEAGKTPDFWWSFHKDTGSCTAGAGTFRVSGAGKTKDIKVYKESGRCEG